MEVELGANLRLNGWICCLADFIDAEILQLGAGVKRYMQHEDGIEFEATSYRVPTAKE
jgi:hypothetical protein